MSLRWQFSVDFRIPESLRPLDEAEGAGGNDEADTGVGLGGGVGVKEGTYYVPVALLRKWEPLRDFDFRDESGDALHLLTGSKNREIDACALVSLAPLEASASEAEHLRGIALGDPAAARARFSALSDSVQSNWASRGANEQEAWVRTFQVAGALVTNSLLWVCVQGQAKDRRIVKVAYEEPTLLHLTRRRLLLAGIGWGPHRFWLPIPNLGQRDSYHMQIQAPEGMELHNLKLFLQDEPIDLRQPAQRQLTFAEAVTWNATLGAYQLRKSIEARTAWLRGLLPGPGSDAEMDSDPEPVRPYVSRTPRHGHVYLGQSRDQYGFVELELAVPNGWIGTNALAMSVTTAALMTIASIIAATAGVPAAEIEPWVTILLFVPALLAFVLLRPGEHPLARSQLYGVRVLTLVAGALPIFAALTLLATPDDPDRVLPYWIAFATFGWLTSAALLVSWLLPFTRAGLPDSPLAPRPRPEITVVEDYRESG